MSTLSWFIQLHLKQSRKLTFVLIFSILQVFLIIYPIAITSQVIDEVLHQNFANISLMLLKLLGFSILLAIIFFSVNFVNEILAHRITTNITQELFESLQAKSLRFHNELDVGQIMARATGDTRIINNALSPGIVRTLTLFTTWIVAIYISSIVDPRFVVFTIFMFVIYLFSIFQFTKSRIIISQRVLQEFSDLNEFGLQTITNIREIKSFVAEPGTLSKYSKINDRHAAALRTEGIKNAWFYPALVSYIYVAGMVALGVYFVYLQEISFADIVLIAGILIYLRAFSSELQWQARMIVSAIASTKRVYILIHQKDEEVFERYESQSNLILEDFSIEFKDVSFQYSPKLPLALQNISFKIDDNQTVAIVGGPGSGKSTLTKLIQRLYLPTSGEILIGGIQIETIPNIQLRSFISTVEQDIFLFNKSIRDNIKFGKPEAANEEVEYVAKLARADEFIHSFPEGYNTLVGEGGVRLSGGQAQRISIARALMVNPSILLLDDGASALDSRTELEIQSAISEILRTRTTVITTHRLSIIAQADLIIILEKGRVVGLGNHENLIRTNPYYRRLFDYHYDLPALEIKGDGGN